MDLISRLRGLVSREGPTGEATGGAGPALAEVDRAGRRSGGHRSHWDTVVQGNEEMRMLTLEAVQEGVTTPGAVGGDGDTGGQASVAVHDSPVGPVRARAVARDSAVVTAFPTGEGLPHQVSVTDALAWESGLEAQVRLDCGPTTLAVFDAGHALDPLSPGDRTVRELAAFAYRLEPADAAPDPGVHEGTDADLSGTVGLLSFENGGVDDYVFRTVVREVDAVHVLGRTVYRVRVPLARTPTREVEAWLYAAPWTVDDYTPSPGDDVSGVAWVAANAPLDHTSGQG